MANLIESVQRHLAFARLEKESPNQQKADPTCHKYHPEKLDQACISAVLAGIYQFTREESEAAKLLMPKMNRTWLEVVFHKYPAQLEKKIADYTQCAPNVIRQHLYAVAQKAVLEIKSAVGSRATGREVKSYLTSQRMAILTRLPAELEVGSLLHNTTLDDATNKMHGPFSDFMHWVETYMAEPQTPLY
ncbi:hypothetical protein [Arachidicoccus terrestris]|uniref:hypothetical protein n=1 Tax=Arachidicoccus terrestris TaxID=2875539 RepID=UPI001CC6CBA5|nr:hypothetical protein [Arachidicoccus terrestris]UAY56760.1 hypothetical protein K9M52_07150 [Arachidicoccus terrestris]